MGQTLPEHLVKRQEEREKAQAERTKREKEVRASWDRIKGEAAIGELSNLMSQEVMRCRGVAGDGMGLDSDGEMSVLTKDERIAYLDRANGVEWVLDYVGRKIVPKE